MVSLWGHLNGLWKRSGVVIKEIIIALQPVTTETILCLVVTTCLAAGGYRGVGVLLRCPNGL